MSSENKALSRLKICEKIIEDHKVISCDELESLMFYQFGILPRTTANYVKCLCTLKLIELDMENKTWTYLGVKNE